MTSKRTVFTSITAVVLFVILLHALGWLRPVEKKFRQFINIGSQALYQVSIVFHSGNTGRTASGVSEEDIKNACEVEHTAHLRLEDENKELRDQLQFLKTVQYARIGADVIGRNIDPIGTTLVLNQGRDAGIHENDPVIVGNGILIGKVGRVNDATSIVRLINDNGSRIAGTLMNHDKSIGLVEGGYGLSVQMNFIPQNEVINQGDTVITSGLEEGIPRGLLIGTVEVVEKTPQGPFQEAILRPATDLQRLTVVTVLHL